MAPRATFKGYLRLSLVSVPVKAFTAAVSGGDVRLNQLHRDCNSRVKYQKVCPQHGELKSDQIVSGYEYTKDQYVVIEPEEIQAFRKKNEKAVDISGFIKPERIDARYFSGRTYYLLPDGPAGGKPYQLLHKAMVDDGLWAMATAILSGREQLVVIRPVEDLLGMTLLTYSHKIKKLDEFVQELPESEISDAEMELTRTLIGASMIEDFDIEDHDDEYNSQMTGLIQAKVDGQEIVAAPDPEEPKVINLMEALKASVASVSGAAAAAPKKNSASKAAKKSSPVKTKMAPSAMSAAKRKKKSG